MLELGLVFKNVMRLYMLGIDIDVDGLLGSIDMWEGDGIHLLGESRIRKYFLNPRQKRSEEVCERCIHYLAIAPAAIVGMPADTNGISSLLVLSFGSIILFMALDGLNLSLNAPIAFAPK